MCIACTEFIKGTLNLQEFKSALREITREDSAHLLEIEQTLREAKDNAETAKRKLRHLGAKTNGTGADPA